MDLGVLSPRPRLARHWGLTSHAKHELYPPSSGLSSASWSFRCVVRGIHSPRAQRTSPLSSIPVCGTPCVCGVSACVFMQCLCRSPASEGAFLAPGAPSSSFVPQEASSLGRTGPGLWGLTLPGQCSARLSEKPQHIACAVLGPPSCRGQLPGASIIPTLSAILGFPSPALPPGRSRK